MDLSDYDRLFKSIVRNKHGSAVDFAKVESRLGHLREGQPLAYSDLAIIGDDECWPFSKYWLWPAENQISHQLDRTAGWFSRLPDWEERIIADLDAIFKNISLVSIILRFVHPEYYAIYSRPVLKALKIERGRNDTEEYLNYLRVTRTLMRSYGVSRTADVDIIIWAISKARGKLQKGLAQVLACNLPECLTPGELLEVYEDRPLRMAELYLDKQDHKTAGYWAAIAFDRFLDAECPYLPEVDDAKCRGYLQKKVEWLGSHGFETETDLLHQLRILRNKAIHPREGFTRDDAQLFLDAARALAGKAESMR